MIIEVHALDDSTMKLEMFVPSKVTSLINIDYHLTIGVVYSVIKIHNSISGRISVTIVDDTGFLNEYPISNFQQK